MSVTDEPNSVTEQPADRSGAASNEPPVERVRGELPETAGRPEAAGPVDEPGDDLPEVAEWADDDDLLDRFDQEGDAGGEAGDVAPLEEASEEEQQPVVDQRPMDWYILKVQSNREDSIADALRRRVKVAGLEEYFDEIIVPVEMVTEFKGGKKKVVKRKLYPGYIVVHMIINDESWYLVRDTPGIGDFTGSAGRPTPMLPNEVARIVPKDEDVETEEPKLQIGVNMGDRVKINEGTFENFEGEVDQIDRTNGRVTVMINIFGRSTPVELEHWQIEKL